jgi:hypothetical protein
MIRRRVASTSWASSASRASWAALARLSWVAGPCALVVACGGAITESGSSAGDDAGGGGGHDGGNATDGAAHVDGGRETGSIVGSFDVSFASVTYANALPPFGNAKPASFGKSARVDIRQLSNGGLDAVFTARWGTPAVYAVRVDASAVTLAGKGEVWGTGVGDGKDTWASLRFARGDGGALSGSMTANGSETVSGGDMLWQGDVLASGSIVKDATAPEVRAFVTSQEGPEAQLLAWEPLRVQTAEGVDASKLSSSFSLRAGSQPALPVIFTVVTPDTEGARWAGATGMKGVLSSWDAIATPSLTLSAPGTLTDLAGHASLPFSTPVSYAPLMAGQRAHGFDSDVLTVASWGQPLVFLGGFTGSDPHCENGGCAEIGPFQNSVCGAPRIGIAGMIDGPLATKVVVRYRVLFGDGNGPGSSQPPPQYGAAFTVDVAIPGAEATSTGVNVAPSEITLLATTWGTLRWGTPWKTMTFALPGGASPRAGFAVRAGAYAGSSFCGGPVPQPVETAVLVDSVAVE